MHTAATVLVAVIGIAMGYGDGDAEGICNLLVDDLQKLKIRQLRDTRLINMVAFD